MAKPNVSDEDFYLPPTKEARKTLLKQYISTKLSTEWLRMPKKQADMERRFFRKLINSL